MFFRKRAREQYGPLNNSKEAGPYSVKKGNRLTKDRVASFAWGSNFESAGGKIPPNRENGRISEFPKSM